MFRMTVLSIHSGCSREDLVENTGFELLFDEDVQTTTPPSDEELRILREEVDPTGVIIGRQ